MISQDGTTSRAITVTVNGAAEASTGGGSGTGTGGGGTTPPTDPALIFDIGLENLFILSGDFLPIPNFTQNDLINFGNGVQYLSYSFYDYIPGDSNTQDSTSILVELPSLNGAPPEQKEIILIGFANFNQSMILPS